MLAKIDDSKVTLIKPRFDKHITLPTGFSQDYLSFGFFYLLKEKDYFMAFIHVTMTLLTLGLYWVYFAKIGNDNRIKKLISEGCRPATKEDEFVLRNLNLVGFDYYDTGYVGVSGNAGYEHGISKNSADHLRKR